MKYFILIISIFISTIAYTQDLHNKIIKTFNFHPHSMSSKEQNAIIPKLDSFFVFIKNNKSKYLEPLRSELKRNDNNPYFYFDGSVLLLEISKTKKDYQLVADALTKTDLRDLPSDIYLKLLLDLSLHNANVINAALHILDDTSFFAYIPQHSLSLKYATGLKFILSRYPAELYIDKLIEKFNSIESTELKITFLDLFIYASSCKADKILATLLSSKNEKIREATKEALHWSNVTSKTSNHKSYLKYFKKRKKIIKNISDETGYKIDKFTLKMRESYKCKKL